MIELYKNAKALIISLFSVFIFTVDHSLVIEKQIPIAALFLHISLSDHFSHDKATVHLSSVILLVLGIFGNYHTQWSLPIIDSKGTNNVVCYRRCL